MKTLVLAALFVSTSVVAQVAAPEKIHDIGKAYVAKRLLDPDSAKFESVAIENSQGYAVCGILRARNTYGGYAKPRYFFAQLDKNGKVTSHGIEPVSTTQRSDERDEQMGFYPTIKKVCFEGL